MGAVVECLTQRMEELIELHTRGVNRWREAPRSLLHEVLGEDMMNDVGEYPY